MEEVKFSVLRIVCSRCLSIVYVLGGSMSGIVIIPCTVLCTYSW